MGQVKRDCKGRFLKDTPSIKGMSGKKVSKETKEKMKKWMILHNPFRGKKHTEETRAKMREKRKLYRSSALGKRWKVDKDKLHHFIGRKGSLNHNWKGGITSVDRLERIKFRKQIQKQVFERDNYTCQICSQQGIDLQVDHIQPWAEYIELRFEMTNCRTLCAKCHYQITFGKPMPPTVRAWGHNLLGGTQS